MQERRVRNDQEKDIQEDNATVRRRGLVQIGRDRDGVRVVEESRGEFGLYYKRHFGGEEIRSNR